MSILERNRIVNGLRADLDRVSNSTAPYLSRISKLFVVLKNKQYAIRSSVDITGNQLEKYQKDLIDLQHSIDKIKALIDKEFVDMNLHINTNIDSFNELDETEKADIKADYVAVKLNIIDNIKASLTVDETKISVENKIALQSTYDAYVTKINEDIGSYIG